MINPNTLKTVLKDTKVWPNKEACVVEIIANDNSKYEATVEKEEVDLALYLKTSVFKHLKSSEQSKLLQLIEDFGSMKYVDGSNDNAI